MSLFNETPLLPPFSQFGSRDVVRDIAKKMKIKLSSGGKPLSRKQLVSRVSSKIKSNPSLSKPIIQKAARSSGLTLRRSNREKTPLTLWRELTSQSSFGWWDNTQKSYCVGSQCAFADQVGSGLPYEGTWPAYASLRGPSFGSHRRGLFGPY